MTEPTSTRPPLGLPSGSVRALLTLMIVGVVITQVVRGEEVAALWAETLMIALAHYFTSRRLLDLPPEAYQRLEAEGLLPKEGQPLYLPRHSVRILIFGAFAALAAYLYFYKPEQLTDLKTVSLFVVVATYVLGMVVRSLRSWLTRGRQTEGWRVWEDLKAGIVLLALTATAGAYLLGYSKQMHDVESVPLGLVLFYFGSR